MKKRRKFKGNIDNVLILSPEGCGSMFTYEIIQRHPELRYLKSSQWTPRGRHFRKRVAVKRGVIFHCSVPAGRRPTRWFNASYMVHPRLYILWIDRDRLHRIYSGYRRFRPRKMSKSQAIKQIIQFNDRADNLIPRETAKCVDRGAKLFKTSYEKMVSDPKSYFAEIFKFIGCKNLDWFPPRAKVYNRNDQRYLKDEVVVAEFIERGWI